MDKYSKVAKAIFDIMEQEGVTPLEIPGILAGCLNNTMVSLGKIAEQECTPTVFVADTKTPKLLLVDGMLAKDADVFNNAITALTKYRDNAKVTHPAPETTQ